MKKDVKKYRIIISITLIVIMAISVIAILSNSKSNPSLTFREAYMIAREEAVLWNDSCQLLFATSVDLSSDYEYDINHDGKRVGWNFSFTVPESQQQYIVEIKYKKIYSSKEILGAKHKKAELIENSDIVLDSDTLLRDTMDAESINPGKDWAIGYHFQVMKIANIPTINLICLTLDGAQQKKYYNLRNGDYLYREVKELTGGGVYKDYDKYINLDDHYSATGINIVSSSESLIWGYKNIDQPIYDYFLQRKRNKNIEEYLSLPYDVIYSWVDNNETYVLHETGIISTNDNGDVWSEISGFDSALIDYSIRYNILYLLFRDRIMTINITSWQTEEYEIEFDAISLFATNSKLFLITEDSMQCMEHNSWKWSSIKIDNYLIPINVIDDYFLTFTNKEVNIIANNNNDIIKKILFDSTISKVIPLANNDFAVVLQTGYIYYYTYKGDDIWSIIFKNKYEGDIISISQCDNNYYVYSLPKSVWRTIK